MKVKELKELIADLPDDALVLCPAEPYEGFTGHFFSPCNEASGYAEMGVGEPMSDEDIEEAELLGKEVPVEKSLVLVPCGFFEEKDQCNHQLN